ncbi:Major facilitator superfamily MFS_1 [Syntrophobacter sp. SbD1]|nr:Major facilitator superfamily MFS_1 [Syntrophobacter sp. SbD1]
MSIDDQALSYRKLILISFAAGLGCYTAAYMRIPILPLYARSLGIDTIRIGVINSLFMLAAAGMSMPLGILSDRLGRKRLVMAGILISASSSLLLGFSRTFPQMMVINLFAGFGLAAFGPTMMSFVADFSPPTHLGRSYGWYTMAIYGGMSLGPAIGGFFAHLLNYNWAFMISGTLGLIVFSILLFSFPKATRAHSVGPPKRDSKKIIRELFGNHPLMACWLVTLVSCFGLGVFITFLPLHASEQGVDVGKIGLIFGTQAIVNALGRIPFGYLGDRVSRRSSLVFAGLLCYSLSNVGLGLSTSLAMFLISAVLMGIGMGIAFTAVGALISELVPADSRGFAMGGYTTCIYIGMMLSSLIMGVAAGVFGFRVCFLVTAGLIAVGASAFSLIFRSISIGERALFRSL